MFLIAALTGGLLMSTLLTFLILTSLARNPRALIINGPPIMQETLAPLTQTEKRALNVGRVLILLIILFMPLALAVWYERAYQPLSYGQAFLFLWIIWMSFNLVDLLIIDWLVLLWWQPSWLIIPNARPYREYTSYGHHFRGFLKGTVMMAVFALIYALILVWI
jgi:hypothetical protein